MEAQIKLLKKQLLQATQARDENKSAELMRARELAKCEKVCYDYGIFEGHFCLIALDAISHFFNYV